MEIDLTKIIPVVVVAWFTARRWIDALSKILSPIVQEIERLALDGLIDKADRKIIALKAVEIMQRDGYIHLNFITRFIVGRIIDRVAGRLPDFKVTKNIKGVVDEAKKLEVPA